MNRLLLLEDDQSLIDGLQYSLLKNGFSPDIVRTIGQAKEALAADASAYDLLLLDVTLPDGSGFEICRQVRAAGCMIPIIFLTAADEETSIIQGLDIGADDYITKPFRLGELCSRIRALLRRSSLTNAPATGKVRVQAGVTVGSAPDTPTILCSGDLSIDLLSQRVFLSGRELILTGTEYRLLLLLAQNAGRILPRSVILDALWDGCGNFVDDNTLSVCIRRLREKVEDTPSEPARLTTVRGLGYRWEKA